MRTCRSDCLIQFPTPQTNVLYSKEHAHNIWKLEIKHGACVIKYTKCREFISDSFVTRNTVSVNEKQWNDITLEWPNSSIAASRSCLYLKRTQH